MGKFILGPLMILHGLIHLIGFAKGFRLAEMTQLSMPISRPVGLLWLTGAILFSAAAAVLFLGKIWWWPIAAAGLVLSQILVVMFWKDAKFGTIANVLILAGLVLIQCRILKI